MPPEWRLTDDELLEEIVSRGFLFFWNEAGKQTGLVRDRALADGGSRSATYRQHRRHRVRPGGPLHRPQTRLSSGA